MASNAPVDPTRLSVVQLLLLRAAFLSGQPGQQAWQQWRAKADLQQPVDAFSYRLLAQLYHNLVKMGVDDPLVRRLKGVAHQNWTKNQLALRPLAKALHSLHESSIASLLLYQAALAASYVPDDAIAAGTTWLLLVHAGLAVRAINVLSECGWKPAGEIKEVLISQDFLELRDETGCCLHLFWQVPPALYRLDLEEEEFWSCVQFVPIQETPVLVLNPAAQIVHLSLPAAPLGWRPLPRRAADILLVLANSPFPVEWQQVAELARKAGVSRPVRQVLTYIQSVLPGFLAPAAQACLAELHDPAAQEFKNSLRGTALRLGGSLPERAASYDRQHLADTPLRRWAGFAGLLRQEWGLKHTWQVPLSALGRLVKKILG